MSRRKYREFEESVTNTRDPEKIRKTVLLVGAILLFVIGIGVIIGFDVYKRVKEDELAKEFHALVEKLEIEKAEVSTEYNLVEYNARKEIGCAATCTLLIDEPRSEAYDIIFKKMKDPAGDGSVRAKTGILAVSPNHLPGAEGNMSLSQFFEMTDGGWTHALRYRGIQLDGPFADYLDSASELLRGYGIEPSGVVYFDYNQYNTAYDEVLKAKGYKYAIHHGEEQIMCIETGYEGDVLHPGATGWNTIGLNAGLLSELMYTGGYTVLYVGFEVGFTSFFATDSNPAIESFYRMIDAYEQFEQDEEILFFASPDEAFEYRAEFMKQYEERLPEVEARKAELQARLDDIELQIIKAYADFFKD